MINKIAFTSANYIIANKKFDLRINTSSLTQNGITKSTKSKNALYGVYKK